MHTPPTGTVNPAEFADFMRAHQDRVFATALRLTAQRAQAEDIAQEVFVRAFGHFDALRDNPAAPGWLRTVTTRLCLNHLSRYRRRWRLFSELAPRDEDGGPAAADERLPDEAAQADPAAALDAEARSQHVEAALARLPDHQRVPLVLFHFEELDYETIAALLDVSLPKLKTDLHRGRQRLARELGALR